MDYSSNRIQTFQSYPRQTLSDAKKTDEWFKKNLDFAESIITHDNGLRASFSNKKINYDLRANIINPHDFEKIINPDKLDLTTLPATFQHIGIENIKINLLLGEYSNRRKEFRVYLSSGDKDGIGRKEQALMEQTKRELTEMIQTQSISPEEIQKRLESLNKYQTYEFQDVAEIVANKILKKEYKEQDCDFIFLTTFEDLLTSGEEVMYCGVLGGNPVMRKIDPRTLATVGGNSMYIEDRDLIVEYGYKSVGQVIDDYWDELSEKDVEYLETGKVDSTLSTAMGLNNDISIYDRYGEEEALKIFHPNELGIKTFGGAFDTYGNVRVLKVCWRSRRKIGKLKYFDEEGQEQSDYVPEDYKVREELGEEVKWQWVNEWMEGTKIADCIYITMRPVPYASQSMVNKSKGTPPFIGSINSTNGYKVQSLMDVMKPLSYSYDIAYYKRELEIATYKGSFAAINSAMIPSGWSPEKWMRYVTINKFAWLDPTNEILKGPSQGKSAGAFNTLTATNVQLGDPEAIQMYSNLLLDIETTLGKVAGISGGREGQIENREAVNNVEREITQTSHITEKWFAIDSNFRRRVLTKFLECCKYAYKMNPKKGQFLLDDLGQYILSKFDEFVSSDFDLHVGNSRSDTELFRDINALSQAAIQNGQATISDLIAVRQNDSVQAIARKLEDSARTIAEQNNKMETERLKAEQINAQAEREDKLAERDNENMNKALDREIDREKIQANLEIAHLREIGNDTRHSSSLDNEQGNDSDDNGVGDYLDIRRASIDERFKNETIDLNRDKLSEQIRSNKEKEKIAKMKTTQSNSSK